MKKITLLALLAGFFSYSQDPLWSTDCEDYATADFIVVDLDGDGNNFAPIDYGDGVGTTDIKFFSASYDNAAIPPALTPDNWLFSPEMTIPANTESVTLTADVFAQDSDWAAEKYSIGLYDLVGDLEYNFRTEVLTNAWSSEAPQTVSITITSTEQDFSGLTLRMYVRHFETTDQFRFVVDNLSVSTTGNLSVEGFNTSDVELYPNPTNGLINIAGTDISNIKEISIFNQLGQKVMKLNASQLNNNSFDISDLNTGVYFVQLKDDSNNSKTMKIVKE
jgi:hypothetical protein